jgi:hypothetical protein
LDADVEADDRFRANGGVGTLSLRWLRFTVEWLECSQDAYCTSDSMHSTKGETAMICLEPIIRYEPCPSIGGKAQVLNKQWQPVRSKSGALCATVTALGLLNLLQIKNIRCTNVCARQA